MKQLPTRTHNRPGWSVLAGLCLLLAVQTSVSQPQQTDDQAAAESTTRTDKSPQEQAQETHDPATGSARDQRFTPTEQISEDLSVSFPVDI